MSVNDNNVGRNMDEYVRLVSAFNYSEEHGENCPATWQKKGDDTITGNHNDEKTKKYWTQHLKK